MKVLFLLWAEGEEEREGRGGGCAAGRCSSRTLAVEFVFRLELGKAAREIFFMSFGGSSESHLNSVRLRWIISFQTLAFDDL